MKSQKGGFALGLVVGLLLGLAVALGVALYVTKVPVPILNKGQQRTPEQDAAEAERNKNWDPNASLAGKSGAPRPPAAASGAEGGGAAPGTPAAIPRTGPTLPPVVNATPTAPAAAPSKPAAADAGKPARDPAAILSGQGGGADPFIYYVQVGAYSKPEDAEQQRAKLAMQGVTAKVSEREQNGRTVHRVRVGPFETREDAESQQEKLRAVEPEASLVRIERTKQ